MLSKARSYLRYDLAKNTRHDVHQRRHARRRAFWTATREATPLRTYIGGRGFNPHGACRMGTFRDRARSYFPYIGMCTRITRRHSDLPSWEARDAYMPQAHAFDVVDPSPRRGNIASRLRQLKRGW